MSYVYSAVRSKPSRLWIMGDAAPFNDSSSFGITAPMSSGTASTAAGLVSGATNSTVLDALNTARFPTDTFREGYESKPFTIEAWVYPISVDGTYAETKVLSHLSAYDGLLINGKTVAFATEYLSNGSARAEYELQQTRKVHLVGVHTSEKNMLYVDGELVAEQDISDAQQADQYVATNGNLYAGANTGTSKIAINGVAVYDLVLSADEIKKHYEAGNRVTIDTVVTDMFGGTPMNFSIDDADTFNTVLWTGESLDNGDMIKVVNDEGTLRPIALSDGTSEAGSWTGVFSLDSESVSIYGVSLDWEGQGVTVEVSDDAATWETVTKRTMITTVPDGYDPTDKELYVRASFPGGIVDDESYIKDISVVGWDTGVFQAYTNRTVTLATPAVLRGDVTVIDYRDDVGVYVDGGSLTVSADASPAPVEPRVVEMWVKIHSGLLTVNQTGTEYVNGQPGSTIDTGEWTLYHIVTAAPITGSIVISGDVSVAHLGLYPTTKTAGEIADIMDAFTSVLNLQVQESSTLSITGTPDPVKIYGNDWAITSAG